MAVGVITQLQVLRARVIAATDKDTDPAVSTAQLNDWIGEAIRELWIRMIPVNRDAFTMTMLAPGTGVTFTAPNLYTLSPADAPPAYAILGVRAVDVDIGGATYQRIRPWRFQSRSQVARLSYHVRAALTGTEAAPSVKGNVVLEILPKELAQSYTYRVWYYQAPNIDLTLDANPIALPFGGDTYVAAMVAANVRVRYEEDPAPHWQIAERAWTAMILPWLTQGLQGEAAVPNDWTDDDGETWT